MQTLITHIPVYISFIVCPFGGDLDPDQYSEITRIMDSLVPLMDHDPSDLGSSILSWIPAFQRNAPSINTSKSCFESNLCPIPGVLHQDVMGRDM